MEAVDSKAAAKQLEKLGFTPVLVQAVEVSWIDNRVTDISESLFRVSLQELVVFTRQLASVLEAGVPLIDGLEAVSDQIRNLRFRDVVKQVKKDIDNGSSFSDAMDKHHSSFSPLIVNMVRAGESAGILPQTLDRISNLIEKEAETIDKIKSSTRYPMMVVGTLGIAFVILTIYVIPKFTSFFAAFKAELPLPTRILIAMNYYITHLWWAVLVVVIGGYVIFKKILDTTAGRYAWDKMIIYSPVFGPLFLKINLARFAHMLSAMLASGIPILEALTISSATVDNKVVSKVILDVRGHVSAGKSLAEPMRNSKLFPPIAVSMVAIGEKAGTLEKMLEKVATYFDRESDYTISNLTPLLEPMMIFGLGMVLLIFALGILLPMWDLVNIYK